MKLFAKIVDGKIDGHPYLEQNLLDAGVDPLDPSSGFVAFTRVEAPELPSRYMVLDHNYEFDGTTARDQWLIRDMDPEERATEHARVESEVAQIVSGLKAKAQAEIATASDQNKAAWQSYIDQLDAYVLVDIENLELPYPPRVGEDGTVYTTSSSGSAPDVVS